MYKYELHSHTHECDRDARLSAAELVHAYKEAGYDGIVITDHYIERFYTRWFPEDVQGLSHEQQVKRWLRGYYAALHLYFQQSDKLKIEAKNSGVENHAAVGVLLGCFGGGFGLCLLPQAGPQFPQPQGAQKSDQTRRGEDPQWQQPGEQLRQRQAYRHRHQMDQHHCDRLPQVGKGPKKRILQGDLDPVLKLGLQGEGAARLV